MTGGGAMAREQGSSKGRRLVLHPNGFAIMAAADKVRSSTHPPPARRRPGSRNERYDFKGGVVE